MAISSSLACRAGPGEVMLSAVRRLTLPPRPSARHWANETMLRMAVVPRAQPTD